MIRRPRLEVALVTLTGTLALLGFEAFVRVSRAQDLFGGYRFQAWSSEEFMQEVRINDLLEAGASGLWYLHVQPPMLETLRLLLSFPEFVAGTSMSPQMIDERMYVAYAVLYGILLGVVFSWIRSLTNSRGWSLAGAIVVGLYPGTVAMATLLDGTFPSAVLTTVMLYLLYEAIHHRSPRFVNWWLLSLLLLSWTRTIFQLQILIMIPVLVWLLYRYRMGARSLLAVAMSVILTASLFLLPLKQFLLFGTTATTSFAGNHQIEVVSYRPNAAELAAVEVPPDIIRNAEKFVSGFNSPENVATNYILSQVGTQYYVREPFQVAKNLLWGMQMNSAQAMHWTHDYSIVGAGPANIAADTLPWTPPPNIALSSAFYSLVMLITFVCLIYAFGTRGLMRRCRTYAAFIFVVCTVMITFLLANRYDWSEADRLKYIVEPFFFVLLFSSLAWCARAWRQRRSRRVPA